MVLSLSFQSNSFCANFLTPRSLKNRAAITGRTIHVRPMGLSRLILNAPLAQKSPIQSELSACPSSLPENVRDGTSLPVVPEQPLLFAQRQDGGDSNFGESVPNTDSGEILAEGSRIFFDQTKPGSGNLTTPEFPAVPTSASEREGDPYAQYEQIEKGSPQNLSSLDFKQRAALFSAVSNHPVARLDHIGKYDPTGIIGFCFGRAMTVYLLARKMGLKDEAIRKLFIIGDLRSGDEAEWRFHVTTIVLGTDGRWYAIDPILSRPLEINEWIRQVRSTWDKQKKAYLYITHTSAVLPDVRNSPPPTKEAGDGIMELKFDPQKKQGFRKPDARFGIGPEAMKAAFELDSDESAQTYFLDTHAAGPARFDFLSVTINGEIIQYNNYFTDLLDSMFSTRTAALAADGRGKSKTARLRSNKLGSLRFDVLRNGSSGKDGKDRTP